MRRRFETSASLQVVGQHAFLMSAVKLSKLNCSPTDFVFLFLFCFFLCRNGLSQWNRRYRSVCRFVIDWSEKTEGWVCFHLSPTAQSVSPWRVYRRAHLKTRTTHLSASLRHHVSDFNLLISTIRTTVVPNWRSHWKKEDRVTTSNTFQILKLKCSSFNIKQR